ncbi:hypothetical protein YTPLAS18_38820 [Nitrospira sp.]|nr:hypothetical protein YTPLAS18_38820 [Nitrospira sp.]
MTNDLLPAPSSGPQDIPHDAPPPSPPRKSSWRGKFILVLFLLLLIPLLSVALYLAVVLNVSYSQGERTGYLQKFSRKGWICRTYEGELAMTTVPGVAPILWVFSVWDENVAKRISELNVMGKRVVLHYQEYIGIPTTCFGETRYFVDGVKVIEEPGEEPVRGTRPEPTPEP